MRTYIWKTSTYMNKYIYKWNTSLHIEKTYIQENKLHMENIYIYDHIYSGRHLYTQTHLHMEHAIPIHKTHMHIKMHPIFINTHGNYKRGTSTWRNTTGSSACTHQSYTWSTWSHKHWHMEHIHVHITHPHIHICGTYYPCVHTTYTQIKHRFTHNTHETTSINTTHETCMCIHSMPYSTITHGVHYVSIQQTHKDYISAHTYMHEYTCIKTHMQYKACELYTAHVYNMHTRHVHKTYAHSTCT